MPVFILVQSELPSEAVYAPLLGICRGNSIVLFIAIAVKWFVTVPEPASLIALLPDHIESFRTGNTTAHVPGAEPVHLYAGEAVPL